MTLQYFDPSSFNSLSLDEANQSYTRGQQGGKGGTNYLTPFSSEELGNYLSASGYSGDQSWMDPNASYYQGNLLGTPGQYGLDPSKYKSTNVIYKAGADGRLVPVSSYGSESQGGGTFSDIIGGIAKYGTMAALAWSGGQALGALAGGLSGAAAPAAEAGIGGSGLTSTQAAALYGPEGYGAGMTGAETAAYDAGLASPGWLDTAKQGYDYYNKGKKVLNLARGLMGSTDESAPSRGGAGATGGLSGGIRTDLLGNPQLGAAQAQQQAFLRDSYGPIAAEQRRKLQALAV